MRAIATITFLATPNNSALELSVDWCMWPGSDYVLGQYDTVSLAAQAALRWATQRGLVFHESCAALLIEAQRNDAVVCTLPLVKRLPETAPSPRPPTAY